MKQIAGAFILLCVILSTNLYAQEIESFRIEGVTYDIKGITREFPLTVAVPIDQKQIFLGRDKIDYYLLDLQVQFTNQRIFESSSIDAEYGEPGVDGIIPVYLTIHTVDTWNIIALPYPKYDSNSGFSFKLKLRDYNFFGSMQQLDGDINYEIDNDGKTTLSTSLGFGIPFQAWGYSFKWSNDMSLSFPQGEIPEFDVQTGLNIEIPLGFASINFGLEKTLYINDRNTSGLYEDDRYYINDTFYTNLPIPVYKFDYFGTLSWTPEASVSANWAFDGIQNPNLKGPEISWGHTLSIGRVDWLGNFRSGVKFSLGNDYRYNLYDHDPISISIDGAITGYTTFFDFIGLYARVTGFYNFDGSDASSAGGKLRGILDNRIVSDTAFTLNVDLPIKIMHVNFLEITGVSWTKYIGFEMQASPFFDMAVTHDPITGRTYNFDDGWYSGGMEILVYPMKMRSIYGRISVGFDLVEVATNGGSLSGASARDGKSIRELLIGIGLHY